MAESGHPVDDSLQPPSEPTVCALNVADGDAATAPPAEAAHTERPTEPSSGDGGGPAAEPERNKLDEGAAAVAAPEAAAAAESAQATAAAAVQHEAAVVEEAAAKGQVAGEQEGGSSEADIKAEAKAGVKEESAAGGAGPTDEALVARLRQLLAEVDLATTTEKQLRKALEGEYGVDLSGRKALLRQQINAYLEEQEDGEEEAAEEEQEEEEEEEEEAPKKRKGGSGSSLGSYLSPEMQEFLGVERLPRPQVVKRMWEYIREHNLQDPKNKRVILFDDQLKKLFPGAKTDMFKMQKLLSKHCKTSDVVGGSDAEEEDEDAEEEEEDARPAKKAKSSSSARKRSRTSEGGEAKERKPGAFTKECKLSDELAAFVGKPTASRPEITKYFWSYCKERGLQDPANKSFILADEALKALTGAERFQGFSFNGLIKQHFIGYA